MPEDLDAGFFLVGSPQYESLSSERPPAGFLWLYQIRLRGKKSYVGQTRHSVGHRLRQHRKSSSLCPRIRSALKSCPDDAIEVRLLGLFLKDLVGLAEQAAIAELQTLHPFGYNLTTGGETYSLSAESIEKIAAASRGRKASPEQRRRMSEARRGRKFGPRPRDVVEKIRLKNLGKKRSAEHRAAMSQQRRGKPMAEATKKKISAALTGVPKSAAHCVSFSRGWEKRRAAKLARAIPKETTDE
jgi:ferredoxin